MEISSINNISFTSAIRRIPTETFIRGNQSVTIREAISQKDLGATARAMARNFLQYFKIANCYGKSEEAKKAKEELRLMRRLPLAKNFKSYLNDIVNLDNGKSTILMVEDNNNKNKVVGYAILHSMDKNDRIAIINDAGMEYDFREPFGFYLLRNITNSTKNIFDKVFTRRFPLGSLSSPEYEELGYSFISKEQNSRLDNEYPNESAQNPWLEKDLYN